MKKLLISAILAIGVSTTFAIEQGEPVGNDNQHQSNQTTQEAEMSAEVKQLIQQVKEAPPKEKYIYMNQLKQKLKELSAEERKDVIHEIVKDLKHEGKEEALNHVSGRNEMAEKEVGEEHELLKGENRDHSEREIEGRGEIYEGNMQERVMDREHEIEERKSEIQERTNFRQVEREEREVEHEIEQINNYRDMEERGSFNQNGESQHTPPENGTGNMDR